MPGRPGHYATRDGRVFDGELELEWRYPKPGAAPFVHFRREPERALRCRLKRSSTVRRVVAATFGVWPPPRTGSPPRDMHVASVDGTHHLDALVWVTPGDARRISAAVAGDGITVEDLFIAGSESYAVGVPQRDDSDGTARFQFDISRWTDDDALPPAYFTLVTSDGAYDGFIDIDY